MRLIFKLIKSFIFIFIILPILICTITIGASYAYVRVQMHKNGTTYTETVENILADMVPDEGIVVKGRYYDEWSVRNFLDEIRYDPYNYVHKDHHCVLQYVPEREIYYIVTVLRIILGCY